MRRSAARAGGYYIFALSDLPLDIQRTIRAYGEVMDDQGNLKASSNARTANRQGLPSETADHMVAAMPENENTAQLIKAYNHYKNAKMMAEQAESIAAQVNADKAALLHATTQQTNNARRQEATLERRMKQAGELAKAAQKEMQLANQRIQELARSVDAGQRNLYFQALNHGAFSAAVMGLEIWNLYAEFSSLDQKGRFRAGFGAASASIDTIIAVEMLLFKMKEMKWFTSYVRKTRWTLNLDKLSGFFSRTLGVELVTQLSARLIATAVASLVMMVVCIMDAVNAWQWGDDTVWGFGAMAVGAMLGGIAPFFSGTSVLFGFNPFSLAALVLIVLGAGLVFWLSSTQLEDWLECGPFGAEPRDYLIEPHEALYRLIGIFAGIRIAIEANPYFKPNAKLEISQDAESYKLANANTRIRISSNLPGLLAQMGEVNVYPETRLLAHETRYRGNGDPYPATVTVHNPGPVTMRPVPNGRELYMQTPSFRQWTGNIRDSSLHYEWQVRAQLRLALDTGEKDCRPGALLWLFPTPPIRSGKADPSQATAANFNKTNEPFWADEKTHAES